MGCLSLLVQLEIGFVRYSIDVGTAWLRNGGGKERSLSFQLDSPRQPAWLCLTMMHDD